MSTNNSPYIVIIDAPTTTSTDTASISGANALINSGTSPVNQLFSFRANNGVNGYRSFALTERVKIGTFTVAGVVAGEVYSFFISQDVDEVGGDGLMQFQVSYTAVSGDTVTSVAVALKNMINAHRQLKVTATNAAGVLTLTADAGYPVYEISSPSNDLGVFTETTGVAAVSPSGNAVSGTRTTLTMSVPSSASVVAGDTVFCTGFTTGDGYYVVASVTGTSAIVIWANGATRPTGTGGTVIAIAQDRRFDSDDLIAAGVAASFQVDSLGLPLKPTANKTYAVADLSFMARKGYGGFNQQTSNQEFNLKVYVDQAATAANFDAAMVGLDAVIAGM